MFTLNYVKMKGCIVLVIGLPASGKTQFATKLMNHISFYGENIRPFYIEFDDVVPLETQAILVNQSDSSWRECKRDFVSSCQAFLHLILKSSNLPPDETIDTIKYLEKMVHISQVSKFRSENDEMRRYCFIFEDNCYYKSMREEFFRLAKQFGLGLVLIHIDTSKEVCLRRNKTRPNPVDETIIQRMANLLERPQRNEFGTRFEDKVELLEIDFDHDDGNVDQPLIEALKLIHVAFEKPIEGQFEQDYDKQELKEIARKVTATNLIHRFDNILRDSVNLMVIRKSVKGYSGKELSLIRKEVLKKFANNQLDPKIGQQLAESEAPRNDLIQLGLDLIQQELEVVKQNALTSR